MNALLPLVATAMPLMLQLVECALSHAKVVEPPAAIALGEAEKVLITGSGTTVMVTLCVTEPPSPVHVIENDFVD